jgi:hypothetical protein
MTRTSHPSTIDVLPTIPKSCHRGIGQGLDIKMAFCWTGHSFAAHGQVQKLGSRNEPLCDRIIQAKRKANLSRHMAGEGGQAAGLAPLLSLIFWSGRVGLKERAMRSFCGCLFFRHYSSQLGYRDGRRVCPRGNQGRRGNNIAIVFNRYDRMVGRWACNVGRAGCYLLDEKCSEIERDL